MKRVAGFLLVIAMSAGCAAVPAQHVGVIETFGKVHDATWGPGLHPWAPWLGVHRINCRTLQTEEQTITPTGEGLLVGLDVSLVYHANPEKAAETFARYGGLAGLESSVLTPEFRSTIRDVTAGFNAVDLYSTRRQEVSATMVSESARLTVWYNQGWVRQIIWYALGIGVATALCFVDYHAVARWAFVGYWASIATLIALKY